MEITSHQDKGSNGLLDETDNRRHHADATRSSHGALERIRRVLGRPKAAFDRMVHKDYERQDVVRRSQGGRRGYGS